VSPATARSREILTPGDVAALYDVSRRTALRWMKELHRKHGTSVVAKVGVGKSRTHYITTESAIASMMPERPLTDAERRLRAVETTAAASARRLDSVNNELRSVRRDARAMREELFDLQRKSQDWLAKNPTKSGSDEH
jgi:hypothetical protein